MRIAHVALISLIMSSLGFSATIWVPDNYATIQGAINASSNGDTVMVRPGTYTENIDFYGKAIIVKSEQGATVTVIDGNQSGSVAEFRFQESQNSILEGFTLTNGLGSSQGGGGIYCYRSSPTISNNIISGNSASAGGGICCKPDSNPSLINNLICTNDAISYYGGGIYSSSSAPIIEFCTIFENSAGAEGGGIAAEGYDKPTVSNTIIWNNNAPYCPEISGVLSSVTYSDVKGGYPGTGNIDSDPLFITGPRGDFYLSQIAAGQGSDSPCVDTGDPNSSMITGTTRTDEEQDSGTVDMGYHYQYPENTIIYVPDDYATIQEAIDAAINGDTIIVRSGTYVENINFLGKAISVVSENGPTSTIIDGNQSGSTVSFMSEENLDSIIDGFTIKNGSGTLDPWKLTDYYGGGIFCYESSATIINNIIEVSYSDRGAGICVQGWDLDDNPTIKNNTIQNNYSDGILCIGDVRPNISTNMINQNQGDGIDLDEEPCPDILNNNITNNAGCGVICRYYASDPYIENNYICFNGSTGVDCDSQTSPDIINNTINYNSGCGVSCADDTSVSVIGNQISYNSSRGIYCYYDFTDIYYNTISFNGDGGIYCYKDSDAIIFSNLICFNTAQDGGGIRIRKTEMGWGPTIVNNTIVNNTAIRGGGVCCDYCDNPFGYISNCILWGNTASEGAEIWIGTYPSGLDIDYTDVEGGQSSCYVETGCILNWGSNMMEADPLFADSANYDYHLTWGSPCRNAGDNSTSTKPFDLEGDPRICFDTVDMGADEFWYHLYHVGDVIPASSIDIKVVGQPGHQSVQLALGSIKDPPYQTQHGELWLKWPVGWSTSFGPMPSDGILTFSAIIPAWWSPGDEKYLQALVGKWGLPTTQLTNLMILKVE